MNATDSCLEVQRHYTGSGLENLILEALAKAGKDVDRLTTEDLAPIDQFHVRGRAATMELARAAGLDATKYVLDLGSGIGGSSRSLAREFRCRVLGIDLMEEYCRVAEMLSERVGLSDLATFRQGDALHLPFADGEFDVVWSEHVSMNIADKPGLYREMYRVLKPGGTLAIYDIVAGPAGPVHFPVPWARSEGGSFLVTPEQLRGLLIDARFQIAKWMDTTEVAREWFVAVAEKMQAKGLPPLGLHLLLGPDFQLMAQNQRRNLQEGRISLVQVVAKK